MEAIEQNIAGIGLDSYGCAVVTAAMPLAPDRDPWLSFFKEAKIRRPAPDTAAAVSLASQKPVPHDAPKVSRWCREPAATGQGHPEGPLDIHIG